MPPNLSSWKRSRTSSIGSGTGNFRSDASQPFVLEEKQNFLDRLENGELPE
jgi:hypothetical protein